MSASHTPGPWKVIPSPHGSDYLCVQIGADDRYCTLEMLPADACLTAAAPDLLDALKDARDRMIGSSPAIKALIAKTDAAIAKAKPQ